MIFMVAFIGHDWRAFVEQPWRILIAALVLWLLWLAGKKMENRYHHEDQPDGASSNKNTKP